MPTTTTEARRTQPVVAAFSIAGIGLSLVLRLAVGSRTGPHAIPLHDFPLLAVLLFGGGLLVFELLGKLLRGEVGADLLAGTSIVTSMLLGEHLAGALVVLMLSGGQAVEAYAVRSASSVLEALARRVPSLAHRRKDGQVVDIGLEEVGVGDTLVVFPYAICPVDGTVVGGHGVMDEPYLTGEPYRMSKASGSAVLSGAINGETSLTIRADKPQP